MFIIFFCCYFVYVLPLGSTFIGLPQYNPFIFGQFFQIQIQICTLALIRGGEIS